MLRNFQPGAGHTAVLKLAVNGTEDCRIVPNVNGAEIGVDVYILCPEGCLNLRNRFAHQPILPQPTVGGAIRDKPETALFIQRREQFGLNGSGDPAEQRGCAQNRESDERNAQSRQANAASRS